MNYRHLLFLHVPLGLELAREDIRALIDPGLDCNDAPTVRAALTSPAALKYLQARPAWIDDSLRILERSEKAGVRWVDLTQSEYPARWRELSSLPVIFSYQGAPLWRTMPLISIVGSRTPSAETLQWMQRELSEFFKLRQIGVVSGGARGVDQWAHRLCMDAGQPTICVLPTGLLNPYPFGFDEFWRRILDGGGCILSTCSLKERLKKEFFHIRNRWIAGLSDVVFVAEANRRSGSALTAKLAMEEHKTVCTLPVFPTASQGLANLDLMFAGAMFARDHVDLAALCDYSLRPAALENFKGEEQKHSIDHPQTDGGGHFPTLRESVGAGEAHPVGNQQDQAHDEAASARRTPVVDGPEAHAE